MEILQSITVAVMGATGTGKSTFVKLLTNDDNIHIGHGQESETLDIRSSNYVDERSGRSVVLIDTPGFDDSREGVTDTSILEKIVQFLEPESGERKRLNGIIYMHRVSDPRVGGVSRKNLKMFRSLCGEENLKNVRIVTTNWTRVSAGEGDRREADLKNGAFKALIDAGAQMRRHTNTLSSAHQIMSELINFEAVTMKIQVELQDGKKLGDTSAGRLLAAEMQEMQKKHEQQMTGLKKEVELAVRLSNQVLAANAGQERKILEGRITCVDADRAKLERTLEEKRHAQEVGSEEGRARIRQMEERLAEQRREAQAQRDRDGERQRQLREEAQRKHDEVQRQIAEVNRRIAEMGNSGDDGPCLIC